MGVMIIQGSRGAGSDPRIQGDGTLTINGTPTISGTGVLIVKGAPSINGSGTLTLAAGASVNLSGGLSLTSDGLYLSSNLTFAPNNIQAGSIRISGQGLVLGSQTLTESDIIKLHNISGY